MVIPTNGQEKTQKMLKMAHFMAVTACSMPTMANSKVSARSVHGPTVTRMPRNSQLSRSCTHSTDSVIYGQSLSCISCALALVSMWKSARLVLITNTNRCRRIPI